MSRTLSQIYSESVVTRNTYLQLTELEPSQLSTSKVSIMNLITYVIAVAIYSYENILDLFQIDIMSLMSQRMNGTAPYYLRIAKLFQYDGVKGDNLIFNEDTLSVEYEEIIPEHRIIEKVAYEQRNTSDCDLILKVCKNGQSADSNLTYINLTTEELTAFKNYIDQIKFVGTKIKCISCPGDIITFKGTVYYDDSYITAAQALENVRYAIANYTKEFNYNSKVYFQKIIDSIQAAEHIYDIESTSTVTIKSYSDKSLSEYTEETNVTNGVFPYSGYIVFTDENGVSTINTTNIKFVPKSQM